MRGTRLGPAGGGRWVGLAVFVGVVLGPSGCGFVGKPLGRQVTRKVLVEAAGHATNAVGEELLHRQRVRHESELRRVRAGEPFGAGGPPQLPGARPVEYDAGVRLWLVPNLYGGWNYLTPDGRPVAFSVPEVSGGRWTGRYFFFDPHGVPIT